MVKKAEKPAPTASKQAAAKQAAVEATAATAWGMPLPTHLKDSAQHIWLAGLGAFSKVQAEGSKVFDTLVSDGLSLQRKTQALAEERIHEASSRLSLLGSEVTSRAAGSVDKLENIFEDRVAKALHKLGIPSAQDMSVLLMRIEELQREILRLSTPAKSRNTTPGSVSTDNRKTPASQPAASKSAARKSPARKSPAPKS